MPKPSQLNPYPFNVTVAPATARLQQAAQKLADDLQLMQVTPEQAPPGYLLLLCETRLELHCTFPPPRHGPVFIDFTAGKSAHRRVFGNDRRQHLARAIGIKPGVTPSIIDATAGLACDAFVLATLGCSVTMIEQSHIVAKLVADGLKRAQKAQEIQTIVARMQLHTGNAVDLIPILADKHPPDVIYLDPMYPPREKSAAVKKEMQVLQALAEKNADNSTLLEYALQHAAKRVVVKRPRVAAAIAGGTAPHTCIKNTNTRYDVYIASHPL